MGEYREYRGRARRDGMRIAVVAGRFNDHVTKPLLDGALDVLRDVGLDEVPVSWVPGRLRDARSSRKRLRLETFDAVICLGAVIRGDTPHFEYVAGECAAGLAAGRARHVHPDRVRRADHRQPRPGRRSAGAGRDAREAGNKGAEAARTAVEMVNLLRTLPGAAAPRRPGSAPLMLRLVLPKGSLERQTMQLFEDADLSVIARLRHRLPRLDRRSSHRRGAHPASPGDPAVRRGRALRRRRSPAGTTSRSATWTS